MVLNSKTKFIALVLVTVYCAALLLAEHLDGGVVSHHLLHDATLPKISNWWGLLFVPFATWWVLRNMKGSLTAQDWQLFFGGILFGVLCTALFYNAPDLTSYLILTSFGVALFLPIYRAPFYLGFILIMVYGFGGVLPTVFGIILMAIYAIEFKLIRRFFMLLISKI